MDLYDRNDSHRSGLNNVGTKRYHILENLWICCFLQCYTNHHQNDYRIQKHTKAFTCYLRPFKITSENCLFTNDARIWGTPQSSILMGVSIKNHPLVVPPVYGKPHIPDDLPVKSSASGWVCCLIIPVVRMEGMNAKGAVDPILSHRKWGFP